MAQHDFAPSWLSFPAPTSSTKTALTSEKHPEGLDSRCSAIRRRHNSSDAFDAAHGRFGSGNFGRKEKNGWRSQGRTVSENINPSSALNGTGYRSRSGTGHGGKGHSPRDGSFSENDATWRDDGESSRQFQAADFPSLNPEHETEFNQNKSGSSGAWEYPWNSKSRPSRMLVISKGMKDDSSLSGYPGATTSRSPVGTSGADAPRSPAPKEAGPPQEQPCVQMEEDNLDSSNESFGSNPCAHPDSLEASPPPVDEDGSALQNRGSRHQPDINLNFDPGETSQENRNPFTSRAVTRSSTFPQEVVLSSSLEAEHRLLKAMGWQEDSENETYAPLTEDEMREAQAISEQLQKNGLRKNELKNGLSVEFRWDPWRYSSFRATYEDDDTETSSSDTSDDDYL